MLAKFERPGQKHTSVEILLMCLRRRKCGCKAALTLTVPCRMPLKKPTKLQQLAHGKSW